MTISPLSTTIRVLRCSPACPDPSIDFEAMTTGPEGARLPDLARYISERDESLLRYVEGVEPEWITVRRLPAAFLVGVVDAAASIAQRRVVAFRAAVHHVAGKEPMEVLPPGSQGLYVARAADYGVTLAPEEWVQAFADRFGTDAVQEMGEVALSLSRLPRGAKGPFALWGGTAASS